MTFPGLGPQPRTPTSGAHQPPASQDRHRRHRSSNPESPPPTQAAQHAPESEVPKRRIGLAAAGAGLVMGVAAAYAAWNQAPTPVQPGDVSTLRRVIRNRARPTPHCYPVCTKNFLEKGQDGKYVSDLLDQARHEFIRELGPYIPEMKDTRRHALSVDFRPKAGAEYEGMAGAVDTEWKYPKELLAYLKGSYDPNIHGKIPADTLKIGAFRLMLNVILEKCPENPDQCLKGFSKHEMIHHATSPDTFRAALKMEIKLKHQGLVGIRFHDMVIEGLTLALEKLLRDAGAELFHTGYRHGVGILARPDGNSASWQELGENMAKNLGAETILKSLFIKDSEDPEQHLIKTLRYLMDCLNAAMNGKHRVIAQD